MISLSVQYLIGAEAVRKGVKLTLFNHTNNTWEEVAKDHRPYFFVSHPMSQSDREKVNRLHAKTTVEEKRDFFTDETVRVTRVEMEDFSDLRRASETFENAWEGEVPYTLGYVYDHNLTFGAQHLILEDEIRPVFEVSEGIRQEFEERFLSVKKADPAKYELLERWFILSSQPVPEIDSERLGIGRNVDPEKFYLAFMLSRVANLPVPQAYTNRKVSTWIRSILQNHLRRNNILIPTSRELRSGETERYVQGALTFQPEPGIHFNTVVTDFESLYPSLIDAYNLSYETIDCPHRDCKANKVPGIEHHVCKKRRGTYSALIGSIKDLRIHWFKPLAKDVKISVEERRLAQAASQLLKLILVSSYGVTVKIHGLSRPSLAESITAYGRHVLKKTWDIAKEGGLHPIYGDTDSIFLDNPREEQIDWLIKTVKERFQLDLAVDERYSFCVLSRAMKAYFGVRRDGTPDIKGLTAIKSNSPALIQNVFQDCVKEMADVKNYADFEVAKKRIQKVVRDAIRDLREGRMCMKDLEYSVRLHENPQEKMDEAAIHQPYQCAFQLIDSGTPVRRGDVVNFVKVRPFSYGGRTFTVKPVEVVGGIREVNVDDYIRNLRTALNQTFKSMDIRFDENAEKKLTLSDFI